MITFVVSRVPFLTGQIKRTDTAAWLAFFCTLWVALVFGMCESTPKNTKTLSATPKRAGGVVERMPSMRNVDWSAATQDE